MTNIRIPQPVLAVVWMLLAICPFVAGQGLPAPIQITSPTNGTVVQTGQILNVTVQVQPSLFQGVSVAVEGIGLSSVKTQAPYTFTLQIPNNIAGKKKLVATGITGPDKGVDSPPITVEIVLTAEQGPLRVSPQVLSFNYPGQQMRLNTLIKANTIMVDITNSDATAYTSDNMSITSVDSSGLVTGTGPGTTKIHVVYKGIIADVPVTVKASIPGDLNGDGQVDAEDLAELLLYLNTPATCSNDARDLNHDGKIDALDARIMTTLFTYPRGVTQKP